MKPLLSLSCIAILLLSFNAAAVPGLSKPGLQPNQLANPLPRTQQRQSIHSLDDAVDYANRNYRGRVVGAREIETANGVVYRVRLLQSNGKVRTVTLRP